jgi:hypothetical protein
MSDQAARRPEELTGLFVQAANGRDAGGIAALYENHAVMVNRPG